MGASVLVTQLRLGVRGAHVCQDLPGDQTGLRQARTAGTWGGNSPPPSLRGGGDRKTHGSWTGLGRALGDTGSREQGSGGVSQGFLRCEPHQVSRVLHLLGAMLDTANTGLDPALMLTMCRITYESGAYTER